MKIYYHEDVEDYYFYDGRSMKRFNKNPFSGKFRFVTIWREKLDNSKFIFIAEVL